MVSKKGLDYTREQSKTESHPPTINISDLDQLTDFSLAGSTLLFNLNPEIHKREPGPKETH